MAHDINKDRIRKHKRLAKKIIEHEGDHEKAWQDLHPKCSDSSASASVGRYIGKYPMVNDYVAQLCEENDLPPSFFIKKLKELSSATKTIIYNNKLVEVSDNNTQASMVKEGLKLHKLIINDVNIHKNTTNNTLNIANKDIYDKIGNRLEIIIKQLDSSSSIIPIDKDIDIDHNDIDKDSDVIDI